MITSTHKISNDEYDLTTNVSYTTSLQQRQHQIDSVLGPRDLSRPSSSSGSTYSSPNSSTDPIPQQSEPLDEAYHSEARKRPFQQTVRQQTVRFAEPLAASRVQQTDPKDSEIPTDWEAVIQHPALRISRRTASAILSALEYLRSPFPFSPDLVEESGQMSDLAGGRASNGGSRAGPIPVSQVQQQAQQDAQRAQQAQLRTPTDIMRRRREREEAKLQADAADAAAHALAQARPTSQARPISQTRPPIPSTDVERPIAAPHQGSETGSHRRMSSAAQPQARLSDPSSQNPSNHNVAPITSTSTSIPPARTSIPQNEPTVSRSRPNSQSQGLPRPVQPISSATAQRYSVPQPVQATAESPRPRPAAATTAIGGAPSGAPNFPHAFERWETLSSHWEGLTSYWIRRLEQNTEELKREPLLQQLSRQVTDLSAAGANLFHAVVELQRLRASSERKFQRWFYETRKDAEGQQEIAAQYEQALAREREARANDMIIMQTRLDAANDTVARLEKHSSEMRREQQISKDEARRAWEELGRREQEARDQVSSLREGQPILIGGIQVFPTAHGFSHRSHQGGSADRDTFTQDQSMYQDLGTQAQVSPTNTDPFTETHHQAAQVSTTNGDYHEDESAQATATAGAGFYQHPASIVNNIAQSNLAGHASTVAHDHFASDQEEDEYERDEDGQIRRDSKGRPILYRPGHHLATENDEDISADEHEHTYGVPSSTAVSYPAIPASSSGPVQPSTAPLAPANYSGPPLPQVAASHGRFDNLAPADYEGAGYDEYDDVNQIHSRLSVVDEVDEEASRASEASAQYTRAAQF